MKVQNIALFVTTWNNSECIYRYIGTWLVQYILLKCNVDPQAHNHTAANYDLLYSYKITFDIDCDFQGNNSGKGSHN